MERVRMINVQRLLEAAEFLERRERGNGWTPSLRPPPRAPRVESGVTGAAGEGRCARVVLEVRAPVRVKRVPARGKRSTRARGEKCACVWGARAWKSARGWRGGCVGTVGVLAQECR
jgi:hypothetical protein